MSVYPTLRHPLRGDTSLDFAAFRELFQEVARQSRISFSADFNVSDTEAGRFVALVPSDAGADSSYPFQITVLNDTEVMVRCGYWTRNFHRMQLTCDDGNHEGKTLAVTTGAGTKQTAIYLRLKQSGDYDPNLEPDQVVAEACELSAWAAKEVEHGKNIYFLLGTIDAVDSVIDPGSLYQRWRGGDIDDLCVLPDANVTTPVYSTLEFAPTGGATPTGKWAAQLYGVDDDSAFPRESNSPPGAGYRLPMVYKPYAGGGTLSWWQLDSDAADASPWASLERRATTTVQLYGFINQPTSVGSLGGDDRIIFRRWIGSGLPGVYVDYASPQDLKPWILVEWNNIDGVPTTWWGDPILHDHGDASWHGGLVAASAGEEHDDHTMYMFVGADYTRNWSASFGDTGKVKVIDCDNRYLCAGAVVYLDWDARTLYGNWSCTGSFGATGSITAGLQVNAGSMYLCGGTQVVGPRLTAVATVPDDVGESYDFSGADTVDLTTLENSVGSIAANVNAIGSVVDALRDRMRTTGGHGLIAD